MSIHNDNQPFSLCTQNCLLLDIFAGFEQVDKAENLDINQLAGNLQVLRLNFLVTVNQVLLVS